MSNTKTPNFINSTSTKEVRPMLFGRIFMVCAVGIGVPRVKTVMYALFFCLLCSLTNRL